MLPTLYAPSWFFSNVPNIKLHARIISSTIARTPIYVCDIRTIDRLTASAATLLIASSSSYKSTTETKHNALRSNSLNAHAPETVDSTDYQQ